MDPPFIPDFGVDAEGFQWLNDAGVDATASPQPTATEGSLGNVMGTNRPIGITGTQWQEKPRHMMFQVSCTGPARGHKRLNFTPGGATDVTTYAQLAAKLNDYVADRIKTDPEHTKAITDRFIGTTFKQWSIAHPTQEGSQVATLKVDGTGWHNVEPQNGDNFVSSEYQEAPTPFKALCREGTGISGMSDGASRSMGADIADPDKYFGITRGFKQKGGGSEYVCDQEGYTSSMATNLNGLRDRVRAVATSQRFEAFLEDGPSTALLASILRSGSTHSGPDGTSVRGTVRLDTRDIRTARSRWSAAWFPSLAGD